MFAGKGGIPVFPIEVIGVGPGDEGFLTQNARSAIDRADRVFVARRHAHLAGDKEKSMPLEPLSSALEQIAASLNEDQRVAVLLSGDTGLYSMLPMLRERFGAERLCVYPGISALQALCAEAKESWQDAKIVSGHGRDLTVSALGHAARTHHKVIAFCDAEHKAGWIAAALRLEGFNELELIVGEHLSYPEQRITRGIAGEMTEGEYDPLCMVMVKNPTPLKGLPAIGIEDERFIRGKVPMTKREIRVQILSALALPQDAVVWDIGAGTGSVAIECARQSPYGAVYAIERNKEAVNLIRENAAAFHVNNLQVIEGIAPEALAELPMPTHVFIGGSGGQMDGIFAAIERVEVPVRIVATAVTLEGERAMIAHMADYADFALTEHAVSRMEKVGAYHMMKAQNPVRIASAMGGGSK